MNKFQNSVYGSEPYIIDKLVEDPTANMEAAHDELVVSNVTEN